MGNQLFSVTYRAVLLKEIYVRHKIVLAHLKVLHYWVRQTVHSKDSSGKGVVFSFRKHKLDEGLGCEELDLLAVWSSVHRNFLPAASEPKICLEVTLFLQPTWVLPRVETQWDVPWWLAITALRSKASEDSHTAQLEGAKHPTA